MKNFPLSQSSSEDNIYNLNTLNHSNSIYNKKKLTRIRWLILLLSFFGVMCAYITRLNLSLTIIAMTKTMNATLNEEINYKKTPKFNWDGPTQGLILGSFFYTYSLLQIPGARLAEKYGAKLICLLIIFFSGLLSFLIPFAAKLGTIQLILTRAALGLAQSAIYPSYYALLSKWFPEKEQGRALAFLGNGAFFGTIFTMAFTGYFCEHEWLGGWPAVFYFSGFLCMFWCIAWFWLSASEPSLHPLINKNEVIYIEKDKYSFKCVNKNSIPWKKIVSFKQVWAVIIVKFGLDWIFWLIMLNLPQFLNNVLHFRIHQNGLINSSLNIVLIISSTLGGYLSDKLLIKKLFTKTRQRKLFETFSVLGSTLFLILIPSFQQSSPNLVIYMLLSLMFCFGFNVGGDIPIIIDMTEHYPATIFAIANAICSSCGFLAPLVTGLILGKDVNNLNWSYVFYFSAFINLICLTIFLIFGSADPLFKLDNEKIDKSCIQQKVSLLKINDEINAFNEKCEIE